jgi:hypothetical protein
MASLHANLHAHGNRPDFHWCPETRRYSQMHGFTTFKPSRVWEQTMVSLGYRDEETTLKAWHHRMKSFLRMGTDHGLTGTPR